MTIAVLIFALLGTASADTGPACPTREAVAQALSPALAGPPPAAAELPRGVQITDLGEAFEVSLAGQAQRFSEPARDCAERARMAAVFIALVLRPPIAPAPPRVVVVEPPPSPPPPPAPAAAPPGTSVGLALAARADTATGGSGPRTTGTAVGGEAQLSVGRRALGLAVTAGVLAPTDSTFGTVRVREQRFPCSLAATLRGHAGARLELAGAAGVSLTPFTLNAEGLSAPVAQTRLDTGARVAFAARWSGHTLAPFAEAHLEWFPRSYTPIVQPLGDIGRTALLHVGLSIGVELALKRP